MTPIPINDDICQQIQQQVELLYPAYCNMFMGNKPQLVQRICQQIHQENNLGSMDLSTLVTSLICMYEQQKSLVSINLNKSTHYKLVLEYQGQEYIISPSDVFKQVEPLHIRTSSKE